MVTKLNTPFTVTVTGSRIAITYSATYASVTFSGATVTVTAHPNNTRTTAIADLGGLNAHTVLWDVCTDPVSSDRNDFIANVEALITTASASGSSGGADPTGDAELDSLTVSGATSLSGLLSSTANITAEDILANGDLEGTNLLVTGDTELQTGLTVGGGIYVTGITDVVGALSASSLSVTGGASVGTTLTAANATTTGNHTVGGTLSTTNISASGNSTLAGSLGVTGTLTSSNLLNCTYLNAESITATGITIEAMPSGFSNLTEGNVGLWADDNVLYMSIDDGSTLVSRVIEPTFPLAAEITRTTTHTFSSVTYFDCDRVDYDPSSMVGSTGSPAYSYFQVPLAGMYHIQIRLHVGSSSGALCYLQTAANNTFATSMTQRNANHRTGYMTMSWLRYIPADYYVRCAALQSGGSATTFGSSSVEHQYIGMSIAWVG